MANHSIKAIKYCEQHVPGPQMFYMSHWDEWTVADFYLFILRRDDGKVILVDTGVRDVDEIQPLVVAGVGQRGRFRMDMATQNVPLLLRQEGIDPADVEHVLITHLHYDHCSNVKLFPNANFIVSRTGWHLTLDPPHPALTPDILFPRDVLAYLASEAPRVISPQELVREVQGYESETWEASDMVRYHVYRIRRKIKAAAGRAGSIRTVRGVGYTIEE